MECNPSILFKLNKKQSLAMLDEVFDEATAEAADRLADRFENFFDGDGKLLATYKMNPGDQNRFDRDAFRDHLVALANTARRDAVDHPGDPTAARLAAATVPPQGGSLETMAYGDIAALADVMGSLMGNYPPVGRDFAKYGAEMAEWHLSARRSLASAGLSAGVRQAAERALDAGVQSRLKTSAFTQAVDSFKAKIEEKMRELARLANLLALTNGKLHELNGLDPGDPRIQKLLRRDEELRQQMADSRAELKEHRGSLRRLETNPDTVTETDAYQKIKTSYNGAMSVNPDSEARV